MKGKKQSGLGHGAGAVVDFKGTTPGDFVGCCDNTTFGVFGGRTFHTASKDWPVEAQVRWARANSRFYLQVSQKLAAYADKVEKE